MNDAFNQAALYLDADFLKSLLVAAALTPIFYIGLLLIEEWTVTTLCRELLKCAL